jgi:hypothetical protein
MLLSLLIPEIVLFMHLIYIIKLLFLYYALSRPFLYNKMFFQNLKTPKESSSIDDSLSLFSYHILILSSISPVVYYVLCTIIHSILIVLKSDYIQWFLVF